MYKQGGILGSFVALIFIFFIFNLEFFCKQNIVQARNQDIFINEIAWMGTDVSSNDEWLELYNASSSDVILDGWRLHTQDQGIDIVLQGSISAQNYFLLERTDDTSVLMQTADFIYTGSLSNNGEYLELLNKENEVIDSLDNQNAWIAGDNISKQTMARDSNGNWFNSQNPLGTPRAINSLASSTDKINEKGTTTEALLGAKVNVDFSDNKQVNNKDKLVKKKNKKINIIISEILPNPLGNDEQKEFIELYNPKSSNVDLSGWQLEDESGYHFVFPRGQIILSKGFLIFYRQETKLALNNNGDRLNLYQYNRKTAVDKIRYKIARENLSYNCLDKNRNQLGKIANVPCEWSEVITPGEINHIQIPNRAPLVDFSVSEFLFARRPIIFDSSDTVDLDEDILQYFWNFDDGFVSMLPQPEHTYAQAGTYQINLQVSDGQLQSSLNKTIVVMDWQVNEAKIATIAKEENWNKIIIDKLLPNPKGVDSDNEWVEIVNQGTSKVNLLHWQLDDAPGGSRPYIFNETVFLSPGEKYLFSREDTKVALNNTHDEVRLLAPNKQVVDLVHYEHAPEAGIYIRQQQNNWQWLTKADNEEKQSLIKFRRSVKHAVANKQDNKTLFINLELLNINYLHKNIKLQGVVSAVPGTLAKQYFYISATSSGLQIYNYKKDFPVLAIGDLLNVWGEVVQSQGELRLKIKDKNSLRILQVKQNIPVALFTCAEAANARTGRVIKINGQITEKRGNKLFLDDGSGEILIYIKSNVDIDMNIIAVNDQVAVEGIVSLIKDKKIILPRSKKDIKILSSQSEIESSGEVLGASVTANEWVLAQNSLNREKYIYLIMIGVAIIIGGGYFLFLWLKRKK